MTHDPEWTPKDRALIHLYAEYKNTMCPVCGRPNSEHRTLDSGDYVAFSAYCPAADALDQAQAKQQKKDEPARKRGMNPERSRSWYVASRAEAEAMADAQQQQDQQ